jgi:CRISPR system Cascade subunit CasA
VNDAEQTAGALWRLAENVAQAAGAAPKSGAGDRARERLYAALEAPYRHWLATLGPQSDRTKARAEWQSTVRGSVRPVVTEMLESAGPAAWVGRQVNGHVVNVARAEARFTADLRRILELAFHQSAPPAAKEIAS